jgi:transketolase
MRPSEFAQSCINTIRFLSLDIVEKASSGHPGLESHVTESVEASTGPLGQGVDNALGMAIGEAIPPATLDALRDHSKARNRLDNVTARLLDDGVGKFSAAFDTLLASIEKKLLARSAQHGLCA